MKQNYVIKTFALVLLLVLTGNNVSAQMGSIPELMYFKFDQVSGGTTPNDANPSLRAGGATATVTGLTIGGTGQFNTGLVGVGGANASNNVNPGWTGQHTGSWTISFWLHNVTSSSTRYYFGNSSGNGTFRCFTGGVAGSTSGIRLTGGVPSATLDMPNFIYSTPGVVTYVYDQSTGVLSGYLNGVFQASTSPGVSYPLVGTNFYVGSQAASVEGVMDEFRMYNRALSATEVFQTYNRRLPLSSPFNNAGVTGLVSPLNFCASAQDISVKVSNEGSNVINNVTVNWELNGVLQTPVIYNNPIDTFGSANNSATVILSSAFNFPSGVNQNIKAWTSAPNGLADTVNANDTLVVNVQPSLSGAYTIGQGGNYQTPVAFVNALKSYGVCGPITVNVEPGVYVGSLDFSNINGLSSTNTLTINGGGSRIVDTLGGTKPTYVVQIRDINYLTLDSFIFEAAPGSAASIVVSMGNAHYNTIKNCKIIGDQTSTASAFAGIAISGSASSPTTATNANYNTFENNEISGGYYGFVLYGGTSNQTIGNIIKNNIIRDFYFYGFYTIYGDSTQVVGNNIHRLNRTITTTGYGVYLSTNSFATYVAKNQIHSLFEQNPTSTSTGAGVYITGTDPVAGKENVVVNNVIYNIKSHGTFYGFYNSSSNNVWYYYNTIDINHPSATAGPAYGFYQTTAASGIELKNNSISISKGGSGLKRAYHFVTSTTTFVTDYNNLYVNTSVSGSGVKEIAYLTSAKATLADWQATGAGTYDINSVSANPNFSSYDEGLLYPNTGTLDGSGIPIALISDDYSGVIRDVVDPDIGALEFTPIFDDAGIVELVSPKNICVGPTDFVVRLKNFGINALTNAQVNWSVNGVLQTPAMYSGMLLQGQDTSLNIGSFSVSPNVVYEFKVWSSAPNGMLDGLSVNDTVIINGVRTGLEGVFTLGGVGADFPDFDSLSTALGTYGVCGSIKVDVNPLAGPYTSNLVLSGIEGLSNTDTLLIKGHGSVIEYNGTAGYANILLNNVNYVTIDSFVINVPTGVTSTFGIQVLSGSNNRIINNEINIPLNVTSTVSSGITFSGSATSATTAGGPYLNNVVENNRVRGGYYAVTMCGSTTDTSMSVGNKFRNNKVLDFYTYGFYSSGHTSLLVENNEFARPSGVQTSTFYGIYIVSAGSRGARINGNKIHTPFPPGYSGTSSTYGMYTSSADAPIGRENIWSNNAFYNVEGSGLIYAIYNVGSDGQWYFHNTISLDDQNATLGSTYGFYQTTLASNIQIKNNIFSLTRYGAGGTTPARIALNFATTGSTIISNNNSFYNTNGSVVGAWGTTYYSTLTSWRTANSNAFDASSIDTDPKLNNTKNVIPQNGSSVINTGTPLPEVMYDIEGTLRDPGTPFIGAYEKSGDFSGPIIMVNPIANIPSTSNYSANNLANVTDTSGVDTTVANRTRLYYKLSTHANTYVDNTSSTNGWKYVSATNASSPYNFVIDYTKLNGGSVVVGDVVEYFVVSQDILGNVSTNNVVLSNQPSSVQLGSTSFPVLGIPLSYNIASFISEDTIYVGTGQNFVNLTSDTGLFNYLNNNILADDLTVVVTSNLTENGATALNEIAEFGPGNYHVKIVPDGNTVRTIQGTYTGGLIRLNGADRITIDGSYNDTGRYFYIRNTSTASNIAAIQLIGLGIGQGASNNTIKNCEISTGGTSGNSIGIHIGGVGIPYSNAPSNNNNKILNNWIYKGSVGIYNTGNTDGLSDSLVIAGNIIGTDGLVVGDNLRLYGIALEYNSNARVEGNTIRNILNPAAQQAWGIAIYSNFDNGVISKNKIEKISSGSGAFGGRGIDIQTGVPNSNITIVNNFIANVTGTGSPVLNTTATVGMMIRGVGGAKIYNNSINMEGSIARATAGIADTSAALYITQSNQLDIRNNSLKNSIENSTDTALAYAYYAKVGDTAYVDFDYNNFYSSGKQGALARFPSAQAPSLLDIQIYSGDNQNSHVSNPTYKSLYDLHAEGGNLYQKGQSIASVIDDIDGEARPLIPCIGADEYVAPMKELQAISILYPNPNIAVCGISTDSVVAVIRNQGIAAQSNFSVKAYVSGVVNDTVDVIYTGTIQPDQIDTVVIGYYNNTGVTGEISVRVKVDLTGDLKIENDTVSTKSTVYQIPNPPTIASISSACINSSAMVVGSASSGTIQWFTSSTVDTSFATGDTIYTQPLTGATTYYMSASTNTTQNYAVGPVSPMAVGAGGGTAAAITTYYMEFSVTQNITLKSVDIYPVAAVGSNGAIAIQTTSGQNIITVPYVTTVTGGTNPQTINFNVTLAPGIYRMGQSTAISLYRNTAGAVYPYTSPALNILSNNFGAAYYYYFYNWKVNVGVQGCASARVPVTVTPTLGPTGAQVIQSTPFEGIFNAGTLANPDGACVGNTLTYALTAPTGFNTADLGVTWGVMNPTVLTLGGATPAGNINMNGLNLTYIAGAGDLDSTLVFKAAIRNLATGCETFITRYLKVYQGPTANIGQDQTICAGTSIILDAANPGSSYLWNTGETTQTISVSLPGTYSVVITGVGGCTDSDSMVLSNSSLIAVNLGADTGFCVGGTLVIDAGLTPGASYLWSTGETTSNIEVNAPGQYFVTVTGVNGCSSSDTIVVNTIALPVVNLGLDQSVCGDQSVTLNAGNTGSTYLWSTGETTQSIVVTSPGTYSVVVTSPAGCSSTDAVIVSHKTTPNAAFTDTLMTGLQVKFTASFQLSNQLYAWNFGDPTSPSNTSALRDPIHLFTDTGMFTVTLTITNVSTACTSTETRVIHVTGAVGVDVNNFNTIKMYAAPNPFAGNTKIIYTLPENANNVTMEVFDLLGRKLGSIVNNEKQNAGSYEFNFESLNSENASGVYIVRLNVDGRVYNIRIVDVVGTK